MNSPENLRVLATRSRINPSWYTWGVVIALSAAIWFADSLLLAIVWPIVVLTVWIILETAAVTVLLHRALTHGALEFTSSAYVRFWLWWARAGQVKYWEWVENHAAHHYLTDTNQDSYTPQVAIDRINTPPLRRPNPFRFLDNARSYTRTSEFYRSSPQALDRLKDESSDVASALERLWALEWARDEYGNTSKALWDTLALFIVAVLPLTHVLPFGWGLLATLFLAWLMVGIKVYLYLLGGYIINYYGHQANHAPYQSNVPLHIQLYTFFLFGEGWHELHHDAPYSARFHRFFDPGWWLIRLSKACGLVKNVVIAEKISDRAYVPRHIP